MKLSGFDRSNGRAHRMQTTFATQATSWDVPVQRGVMRLKLAPIAAELGVNFMTK